MTEKMKQRLVDLKAAQENGTYTLCPRCGGDGMRTQLHSNALSRNADVMICPSCGTDEAKLAYMNAPDSLYSWAVFQPDRRPDDFKTLSEEEARHRIMTEQLNTLCGLYKEYLNGEEPDEIRLGAFESCPGLGQLWTEPFQAKYKTADGMLVLRFRGSPEKTEISVSLVTER